MKSFRELPLWEYSEKEQAILLHLQESFQKESNVIVGTVDK